MPGETFDELHERFVRALEELVDTHSLTYGEVADVLGISRTGSSVATWLGRREGHYQRKPQQRTIDTYLPKLESHLQKLRGSAKPRPTGAGLTGQSQSLPSAPPSDSADNAARQASAAPAKQPAAADAISRMRLNYASNIARLGVPGTGKTHFVSSLKSHMAKRHSPKITQQEVQTTLITMHAALSYEEFVEGLRPAGSTKTHLSASTRPPPEVLGGPASPASDWFHTRAREPAKDAARPFEITDGTFLGACIAAACEPEHWHLVVLDEFNRCNVPKVLGDLLTTLEPSKRARWREGAWHVEPAGYVTLPYSKRLFFVPDNLVVLATMNTTDRSVASLDAAVLRRFTVMRIWPLGFAGGVAGDPAAKLAQSGKGLPWTDSIVLRTIEAWTKLNTALVEHLGPDAMLGHSYLFDLAKGLSVEHKDDFRVFRGENPESTAKHIWNRAILPQLSEILEAANVFGGQDNAPDVHAVLWSSVGEALERLAGAGQFTCVTRGKSTLQRRLDIRINAIALPQPADAG